MGGDLFAPPAPTLPGAYMRMCMYKYAYMYGCICMHRRIDKQTVYVSSMYAHTVAGASISMCAYSHATIRRVLSFHLSTVRGMSLAIAKSVPCRHVATLALGRFGAFLLPPKHTLWHVAQRPTLRLIHKRIHRLIHSAWYGSCYVCAGAFCVCVSAPLLQTVTKRSE